MRARVSESAGHPLSGEYRAVTLTILTLISIIAFEAMSISTIMPPVARDLAADGQYGLAFSLMFTAQLLGIVVAAPWIDQRGPLHPTWVGQGLFAVGSLLAGIATSFWVLLVGRLVAGLGAGLILVAIYVMIGSVFPAAARPKMFGWLSTAWVLPSVIGPVVAAWITQAWSWRMVFLLVVPACAVTSAALWRDRATVAARPTGGPTPVSPEPSVTAAEKLDARSAGQNRRTARLGLVVAASAGGFQWASTSLTPIRPLPVVVAGASAIALSGSAQRLLPPGTARLRRGLPAVLAARFLIMAAMNGALTFLPLMLIEHRQLSVGQAGLILALVSLGWASGSLLQGRSGLAGRSSDLVSLGSALVAASLVGITATSAFGLGIGSVVIAMVVCGLGMGLAASSTSVLTLELAPPQDHAQASSALQLADVLGSTIGISLASAVYAATVGLALAGGEGAFTLIWAMTTVFALVAAVAGWRTRRPVCQLARR